jgi:hypothetical protein
MTHPAHPLFEQEWPEGDFRFFQLGHVVDDVLAAAANWVRTFGIGPFHVLPVIEQQADYAGEIRTAKIQVATLTNHYDSKTAHFRALGYSIAAESLSRGFRVAYVDTSADFGFYTEVVEGPPAFWTNCALSPTPAPTGTAPTPCAS